jgi:DNA repair protein RecN (Recombination protein N)
MLKLLSISNLAVISYSQVEFGVGLNILSGETGAGKSIILAALGLLLGERASQDLLRTGETKAVVEGVFEIEGNLPLLRLLADAGIDIDGQDLIIKREIVAQGRGKVFVNHQAATLQLLKTIQPHIIDVHGQGEQQSLLSSVSQTHLLDIFADNEAHRGNVAAFYEQIVSLVKELEESRKTEAERLQILDLMGYQISEIESINPLPDEDAELEIERRLLVNAEKLSNLCSEIAQLLYDDDDAAVGKVGMAQRRMDELVAIDPKLVTQTEQLTNARYLLEDVVFSIRDFADKVTYSPGRLQLVDERLGALDRLKRKYGGDLIEVRYQLAKMKEKLDTVQHSEESEKASREKLEALVRDYRQAAAQLTKRRQAAAKELEKRLKKDLSDVALEKSQFMINFNANGHGARFAQSGQHLAEFFRDIILSRMGNETVEFYFSANKGEEARSLQTVASGGELSRLMLILKTNIAPSPYPRTLVFDEIDTGIGGRVADAVGIRLKRLAQSNQVICVTHQAQIARYADTHLRVSKDIKGQRTETCVAQLEGPERVDELARMMAGSRVTEVTREHAKELLEMECVE